MSIDKGEVSGDRGGGVEASKRESGRAKGSEILIWIGWRFQPMGCLLENKMLARAAGFIGLSS